MDDVTLIHGDCLAEMPKLPSASFDMICADLPYGTTACSWDVVLPFEPLWAEYKRLIKPRGAIVLFGSQPFTSLLVCSNLAWFRYEWIWDKAISGNPLTAKKQPLKIHENVLVFGRHLPIYHPIMWKSNVAKRRGNGGRSNLWAGKEILGALTLERYPVSVIFFSQGDRAKPEMGYHPTQKPVALLEYLILTYTNEGDAVLDNTMGSGTTMVACIQTGRQGTGIELRRDYFETAEERCRKARLQPPLRPNQEIKLPRTGLAGSEVDSSDEAQPVLLVG